MNSQKTTTMKKLVNSALAIIAMFAISLNANAEETTVKDNEETVEINVTEETASKPATAQEVDEVVIYQREDGSVYIVHIHTMQVQM